MDYGLLKTIHIGCVAVSYGLFLLRGIWMMRESPLLQRPWVKVMPHVIDTALLASAIGLAAMLGQYPFVHDWLTAKAVGLLLYTGFGMAALKRARRRATRVAAWIVAQAVFLYIVSVAMTRNPAGFAAWP